MRLAWPEGVAVLIGSIAVAWPAAHAVARPLLVALPLVVLVAGIALGVRFGRGRLVAALLLLLATGLGAARGSGFTLQLISLALPLNLAILAFFPEAGVGSRLMRAWAVAFAVQAGLVAAAGVMAPRSIATALSLPLIPWAGLEQLVLSQFAIVAFVAAIAVTVFRAIRSGDPGARGLLWALVAAFVALAGGVANRTPMLAVAGLSLVVAMVESSYALAFHDDLTGLPGRRAFNQALGALRGRYVIAMVDVDHFKQFNDTHGHHVGDQVLKLVANRLAAVGGGGKAYRYGGEEFAVVFATDLAEAAPHLEVARASVEATTFTLRGRDRPRKAAPERRGGSGRRRDISVTVSIGVAQAGTRSTTTAVVKAADRALYEAKAAGRNRIELSG